MKKSFKFLLVTLAFGTVGLSIAPNHVQAHELTPGNHTFASDRKWVERYLPFNDYSNPQAIWVEEGAYRGYVYYVGEIKRNGKWYHYYSGYILNGPYAPARVIDEANE